MKILDDRKKAEKLDSKNMLGSLELLGAQIEQIWKSSDRFSLSADFKNVENIVVLGMGGSALGPHMVKSAYFDRLKFPMEIVNGYHLPSYVSERTLVIVSSYSGTTEEALISGEEAKKIGAKIVVITSGGKLWEWAKKEGISSLVFSVENNPCGSPRMGLGYSIAGQLIILKKAGLLQITDEEIRELVGVIAKYNQQFGLDNSAPNNSAKQIAVEIGDRSVWYAGAEHLAGNMHVAANQMNENAKRFAGYFLIPELNHHLMEGMIKPNANPKNLLFILIESGLYDERVQKRFEITKSVLDKNKIKHVTYSCQEGNKLSQLGEMLVLSSYISYYSALLNDIDPTAIPFVDFFKEQLKK